MTMREVMVVQAELELCAGVDRQAPGGAVTEALCGRFDHPGTCRWPHSNRIDTTGSPATFRSVVVVDAASRDDGVRRIEAALGHDDRWSLRSCRVGSVEAADQELARRLRGD